METFILISYWAKSNVNEGEREHIEIMDVAISVNGALKGEKLRIEYNFFVTLTERGLFIRRKHFEYGT